MISDLSAKVVWFTILPVGPVGNLFWGQFQKIFSGLILTYFLGHTQYSQCKNLIALLLLPGDYPAISSGHLKDEIWMWSFNIQHVVSILLCDTTIVQMRNIARSTTDPKYWVHNLRNLLATCIGCKIGHQMELLAFPNCLGLPYWYDQLELSCYLH